MIVRSPRCSAFGIDDAEGQERDRALNRTSSGNPADGRAGQGARDLSERMDAILKPETMAGSPDADIALRAASRRLAHGFLFFGISFFVNT
jgi:hypothetical protein